jgi:hypothetical protein
LGAAVCAATSVSDGPPMLPLSKVARSALADGVPYKDLYLSPWHAVYVDGLLVTVGSLVNGMNIVRCDTSDLQTIDYFHIELAQYDIIFAQGAPSHRLEYRWQSADTRVQGFP